MTAWIALAVYFVLAALFLGCLWWNARRPPYGFRGTAPGRVDVEPVVLLYAFRYALGKRSNATGDVARALVEHRHAFSKFERRKVVKAIEDIRSLGDEADEAAWRMVWSALRDPAGWDRTGARDSQPQVEAQA